MIICFKGYNNTKYYSLQRFAKAGITFSVLAILFTIIFMIADIVDLNKIDYVPVHSSIYTIIK